MQVMYKNDTADFVDAKKTDSDSIVNKNEILKVQADYLKADVKGRLVFRIPNGRTLTTFSGSNKSKMIPKVIINCKGNEMSSKPVEGTNPDWGFTGNMDLSLDRKDEFDVTISVYSETNFLGHLEIPFWSFAKQPETWLFNGYYDIHEKKEKLNKGEKTSSLGLIYLQMKWSPEDYPATKTYPPFVTDFN